MKIKPYLQYTFALTWRQKKLFISLLALVLVGIVARLIEPYLYKVIVDTLTNGIVAHNFTEEAVRLMISAIGIWFLLTLLHNIVNPQSNFLGWQIGNQNSQWVHMDGFRRLLRLDYFKHTQKHSSQYAKIVDEADTSMWEMTNWWVNRIIPSIAAFIGMLIVALSVSWQMTLVALAVIPPGLGVIIFMIKRYEDEQHHVNKLWNKKHEHLSDQITNIISYKLNEEEELFLEVQKGFSDRATAAQSALNKKWRLTSMLNTDVVARFLVMGMGVLLVKDNVITLGTLFMFMGLLNEILIPLHLLGDILPQYSRRARHIDRFLALLEQKDEVLDPSRARNLKNLIGKIEFKDVSFTYNAKAQKGFALKNLSFTVEAGEHIALVGHSGAGKSTIAALMTRLVDPTEGKILVDGIDIRNFKQAEYRKCIGTVLQENSLYNETIAQNIGYGKPHAKREDIVEAAKKAQANIFIEKLPESYDTLIGERGVRLSGGEKQRLAIARAILKNPKIVVLDEPTSALDSITEAKVSKGLHSLIEGRTAITIAHRLSTVRNADKILLLRNGQLVVMGSHSELMHTSPEYREMVELQTGGFLADE